jgi:hypothetical protein
MRGLLVALLVVALAGGGLLLYLGVLPPGRSAPAPLEVSPAAAASAEVKLSRLASEGEPARLSEVELTSLFRFRPEVWSLAGVRDPEVRLSGSTLRLSGVLPTDRLPALPELEAIRMFIPDTARVEVGGTVEPIAGGRTVLDISSIEIAGMPIPARFYPAILDRLGRDPGDGLPPTAYPLPLPQGIGAARIENGELILTP